MPNAEDAARIVASQATVSDKIRALNVAGFPRAEIARLLGKRYQHVRNVLEGDKVGRAALAAIGVADEPVAFERDDMRPGRRPSSAPPRPEYQDRGRGVFRLSVRSDGSVLLPPSVREALDFGAGGGLIARLEGDLFVLQGPRETERRIRKIIPKWKPGEPLWSDELIAERRREAALEELEVQETLRAMKAARDG